MIDGLLQLNEGFILFLYGNPRNKLFQDNGKEVYFFFLDSNVPELIRVEILAWLAENSLLADSIHSLVFVCSRPADTLNYSSSQDQHVIISIDLDDIRHSSARTC